MCQSIRLSVLTLATVIVALSTLAGQAIAQVTQANPPPQFPAAGGAVSRGRLSKQPTPDELRDIFLLRALQSRSRNSRGVRTGVPQFVPFGNPGFFGLPVFPMQSAKPRAPAAAQQDPARAARLERHRAAREQAKAKREQAAKDRANARADAKAKAAAARQARDNRQPAQP